MANNYFPASRASTIPFEIAGGLFDAAEAMITQGIQKTRKGKKRAVGATLRPGKSTPLWNKLVTQLKPYLKEHGAQANLARILGVQRQTVHTWVTSQTRMPDAERTLLLVSWLIAKQQGIDPG